MTDATYLRRRIAAERARAAGCAQPAVRRIHEELADRYAERLRALEPADAGSVTA